jgi:hypothetical protein
MLLFLLVYSTGVYCNVSVTKVAVSYVQGFRRPLRASALKYGSNIT